MDYKIPIELEIKLNINDFDKSDIGDKIFKPSLVDEKLGDKLYFTTRYELSPENLDKAGFKNDMEEHRLVLSNKLKMREFLITMQKNDKRAKELVYAEQNLKDSKEEDRETFEARVSEARKNVVDSSEDTKKIREANLNFVLKTFFKKNTNIKISPNSFIIYSSGIGEGKLEPAKDTNKRGRSKTELVKKTTTFNIKIFDKKDKVGVLDMAKVGCKERAERIEKDVFELLGISIDLFQNSNVYNPVNILNKLRENSSKKDAIREERIRVEKERELEKREEKSVRKQAKLEAKEERKRRAREKNKDEPVGFEDGEEEEDSDDDDDDDDTPEGVLARKLNKLELKRKKKEEKKDKKEKEKKEKEKKEKDQAGGYKYRRRSARNRMKTRRKIPNSKRKTRRKYR
jgi:hypothetical protein